MISLTISFVSRSGLEALASIIAAAGLVALYWFIRRAYLSEKAEQRVTEDQATLRVEEWVNVWAPRRRQRVRSKLPYPIDANLEPERIIRVSGLSRAELVPRILGLTGAKIVIRNLSQRRGATTGPSGMAAQRRGATTGPSGMAAQRRGATTGQSGGMETIGLVIAMFLLAVAYGKTDKGKTQKPATHRVHQRQHDVVSNGSFSGHGINLVLVLVLLIGALLVAGWVLYCIAEWAGVYFILSDYRFYRLWVYPTWMFWKSVDPQEVELHMMTSKGFDRNVLGRIFGGFGMLNLDTAGTADDRFFNQIPFVPDVEKFHYHIADAQRNVVPPAQAVQVDKTVEGIHHAFALEIDRLIAHLSPTEASHRADTPGTEEGRSSQSARPPTSDDTQDLPPASD